MLKHLRYWIRQHFSFTRSQTNGMMLLLPLTIMLLFTPKIYKQFIDYQAIEIDEEELEVWQKELTSLRVDSGIVEQEQIPLKTMERVVKRFSFNPNDVSVDEMVSLGMKPYVARTVVNYRESGGQFRIKRDFAKVYGLDSSTYQRLSPLIELPDELKVEDSKPKERPMAVELKEETMVAFDGNTASAEEFQQIRGIGPVLSGRVVKFRDLLGGFVGEEQFNEIYGLDSMAIDELKKWCFIEPAFEPEKLNINQLEAKALRKHPYISYNLANVIVKYRDQHGLYQSNEGLLQIKIMSDSLFQKLSPYLESGEAESGHRLR